MSRPHVFTIILNTNRRNDTLACLTSLEKGTNQNQTVIVIDNASTDGSVHAIRASFPAVEIIKLAENRGYAGNNNVGIRAALAQGADWVLVLNEDTTVDANCLSHLVAIGESNPSVGILGPMVYHFDEPGVIQSAGGCLDHCWQATHLAQNEAENGQYCEPHYVDWIVGCAILVRRGVIEQVGMLDERFFIYYEEIEWCIRATRAGWRIMHVPEARVWHKGVQRDYHPKPSVTYYMTRNQFLMLAKHRAPLAAWVVAWAQTLRTLLSWTIRPKWRPMREHRRAMWQGVCDFMCRRWGMRSA